LVHRRHGGEANAQFQRSCARGLSGHVVLSVRAAYTVSHAAYRAAVGSTSANEKEYPSSSFGRHA